MNANATHQPQNTTNVVPLEVVKLSRPKLPPPAHRPRKSRFSIVEFTNRSGTKSWRVTGMKSDRTRVRANFADPRAAEAERHRLEGEHLTGPVDVQTLQPTHLSAEKIKIAESAFAQLDKPEDMLAAVHHWLRTGKVGAALESCRLGEAIESFEQWLDSAECDLTLESKRNYKTRLSIFAIRVPNVMVSDIDIEFVDAFLAKRAATVGKTCRKNDRRAISRLLSYCVEKKWARTNPCIGQRKRHGGKLGGKLPDILTLKQCTALLRAAEKFKGGVLAPYTALCLLAGLRPNSEAKKITWSEINLDDGEISLRPDQTKTGKPRTIKIDTALNKWLTAYKNKPIYPSCFLKGFRQVKKMAGITKWVVDYMRHTSHSHFFRKTGSFGLTAEHHGNSESIVRQFYVNRVTSQETDKFYRIYPQKKVKG